MLAIYVESIDKIFLRIRVSEGISIHTTHYALSEEWESFEKSW